MPLVRSIPKNNKQTKSFHAKRKEDAMVLAQVLYDIYKELDTKGKLKNGQNYANQIKTE